MREISVERLMRDVRRVLNNPFWIQELDVQTGYVRLHDDHDGTYKGKIEVSFTNDGDAWIRTDSHKGPTLRFRNEFGGGRSPRVKNALLILAYAIMLDEEDDPHE